MNTKLNPKCENCYFKYNCHHDEECDCYTPVGDEAENTYIDELVEAARAEYRSSWFEYIKDFN